MDPTLEQRLTELETRIAFLDQAVQSLDATVAAQDRILQDLQREIALFRGELGRVNAVLAQDAQDEPPPPHY
ncbi:MAG: SlyX family protein [Proteobacteria bacterium]|nr:SlyX family protein [Pseudomonadota bacterium]